MAPLGNHFAKRCGHVLKLGGKSLVFAGLLILTIARSVFGYNPPVDSAAGVTLKIDGPAEVSYAPDGFKCGLIIENGSKSPIRGRIQLCSIDGFQVQPSQMSEVVVGPGQTVRWALQVRFGPRVFNAHYPLHAYGEFALDGKTILLHPILVFLVREAPVPAGGKWKWAPVQVAEDTALALEELPVYRAVFQVFGQRSEVMPVGWRGSHPVHRGTCGSVVQSLDGVAKTAIGIHPPWYQGQTGTSLVEFPLTLPETRPIRLVFALGMVPEGKSDGVTFRVRVADISLPDGELGEVIFERHTTAKSWEPHEVDLSAYAGKTIRLQLESHPGPNHNTGWDSSFWAEPTILTSGVTQRPAAAQTKTGSPIVLGEIGCEGLSGKVEVLLGSRGLLDADVSFCFDTRTLAFHGFEVAVLGARLDRSRSAVAFLGFTPEIQTSADGSKRVTVTHHFRSAAGTFELVGTLSVENKTLAVVWRLENAPPRSPWIDVHIENIALGSWSQEVFRVYAGPGNVVQRPQNYRLTFDGHRLSTSFVGFEFDENVSVVLGCDVPPTAFVVEPSRRHYSLHAAHGPKFTIIPAPRVWDAVKVWREVNGLTAADGVPVLAGRFVFDIWGGRYRESADGLRKAFRYGLTQSLVIWHNWQRWGYDYRLPEIFPPNPNLGTLEDMQYLAETCRQAKVRFALHDNYIDFYPDAEGFSYLEMIAFHGTGQPVRAWFNEGRQAQSYRFRADRVTPFLRNNLKEIAEHIKPTAYFIDVWSSINPYDYWTADGQFFTSVFTRDTWRNHFNWIREFLGEHAPQISESGHDQLIGSLDGATTNHLRVGKPPEGYYRWAVWNWDCEDAERIPWFDAAHHDRFVLHGAGYSERYQGGLDRRLHGIYSDDYITTEVMTGHPAMVSQPFGVDVVRKYWLLSALGQALALDRIEDVQFVGGNIHRVYVRWAGGVETWCNRDESDWEVCGHVLPPYGFFARAASPSKASTVFTEAAIARRDGLITEWAITPESIYVNARKDYLGPEPIRPRATSFQQNGQELEIGVEWSARVPVGPEWVPFAHFCDETGAILFQGQFEPRNLTGLTGEIVTTIRTSMPATLASGQQLELRVGLYRPRDGQRLSLAGPDDGQLRIRLGTLRIEETDRLSWTPQPDEPDGLLPRKNIDGRGVEFGPVVTAQGVRLVKEENSLLVIPLPLERGNTELTINWSKLPWVLSPPSKVEYVDLEGRVIRAEAVSDLHSIPLVIPADEWAARLAP